MPSEITILASIIYPGSQMEAVRGEAGAEGSSTSEANEHKKSALHQVNGKKIPSKRREGIKRNERTNAKRRELQKKSQTQAVGRDDSELREAKCVIKKYKGIWHILIGIFGSRASKAERQYVRSSILSHQAVRRFTTLILLLLIIQLLMLSQQKCI